MRSVTLSLSNIDSVLFFAKSKSKKTFPASYQRSLIHRKSFDILTHLLVFVICIANLLQLLLKIITLLHRESAFLSKLITLEVQAS